jgi:hypothetical protein
MLKKMMIALTFVAVFSAGALCPSPNAQARWWGRYRPYATYYYGPQRYYGYGVPYRTNYDGYYTSPPYYNSYSYYGSPGYYYYRPAPRVAVRVGPVWR